MPRKKSTPAAEAATERPAETTATAVAEPPVPCQTETDVGSGAAIESPPTDGTGKNYGPPYKAVFTSAATGIELGENRRFNQRVLSFKDKPAMEVIERLKQIGFRYQPEDRSWTIQATAESRLMTDRLARELAGQNQSMSR